jgi:hypothetical protein
VRGLGVASNKVNDVVRALQIIKQKVPNMEGLTLDNLTKAGVNAGRVEQNVVENK